MAYFLVHFCLLLLPLVGPVHALPALIRSMSIRKRIHMHTIIKLMKSDANDGIAYFITGAFENGRATLQLYFQIFRIQMVNDIWYHAFRCYCQLKTWLSFNV